MKSGLKFLDPDQLYDQHRITSTFDITRKSLRDAAFDMVVLADAASDFFRGFSDGFIVLAWYDEYHTRHDDGTITRSRSIVEEVAQIAAVLGKVNPADACPTFNSKILCASDKSIIQGLAVETMLLADGCINLLVKAKVVAALAWLNAAYQRIMECTHASQEIVSRTRMRRLN